MEEILKNADALIGYQPLLREVDYRACPLLEPLLSHNVFLLPTTKDTDPFVVAEQRATDLTGKKVVVLIPGSRFDLLGTRHGKGGGWFDRFLSRVPHAWVRLGVASLDQLSRAPLVREVWDEPIDWLIVKEGKRWRYYKTPARR